MKQEILITSSTPAHYEDILRIFNQGFSYKLGLVTPKKDLQMSFARDFGFFDTEGGDQQFVALADGRVLGFLFIKYAAQPKRKPPKGLTFRSLIRKYGFSGIAKALIFGAVFHHKTQKDELYIDIVGVDEDARGRGIGTSLLDFAEDFARRKGLERLTLTVVYENPKAKSLYEKRGYRIQSSQSLGWMKRSAGISGAHFMVKTL